MSVTCCHSQRGMQLLCVCVGTGQAAVCGKGRGCPCRLPSLGFARPSGTVWGDCQPPARVTLRPFWLMQYLVFNVNLRSQHCGRTPRQAHTVTSTHLLLAGRVPRLRSVSATTGKRRLGERGLCPRHPWTRPVPPRAPASCLVLTLDTCSES